MNFDVNVTVSPTVGAPKPYNIEYPFRFGKYKLKFGRKCTFSKTTIFFSGEFICNKTTEPLKQSGISIDVSSDARFFVATGVLSILYCVFITAVYTVIDEIYQSKPEVPLAVSKDQI